MKVETAALAAEQVGQAELAGRLRAQEADLWAMPNLLPLGRLSKLEQEALAQERSKPRRRKRGRGLRRVRSAATPRRGDRSPTV
jgi:hypothetical protein